MILQKSFWYADSALKNVLSMLKKLFHIFLETMKQGIYQGVE